MSRCSSITSSSFEHMVTAPYAGVDWRTHVVLTSSDAKPVAFRVLRDGARLSKIIADLLDDTSDDSESPRRPVIIPVPNVAAPALDHVVRYMEHHAEFPAAPLPKPLPTNALDGLISNWDARFLHDVIGVPAFASSIDPAATGAANEAIAAAHDALSDVIMAASFLQMGSLLELSCAAVAAMVKGRSADDLRLLFNIDDDFTAAEQRLIREENSFDDDAAACA